MHVWVFSSSCMCVWQLHSVSSSVSEVGKALATQTVEEHREPAAWIWGQRCTNTHKNKWMKIDKKKKSTLKGPLSVILWTWGINTSPTHMYLQWCSSSTQCSLLCIRFEHQTSLKHLYHERKKMFLLFIYNHEIGLSSLSYKTFSHPPRLDLCLSSNKSFTFPPKTAP